MNEQLGPSNGTSRTLAGDGVEADTRPPVVAPVPEAAFSEATAQRLAALRRTVDAWDWRSVEVEEPPPPSTRDATAHEADAPAQPVTARAPAPPAAHTAATPEPVPAAETAPLRRPRAVPWVIATALVLVIAFAASVYWPERAPNTPERSTTVTTTANVELRAKFISVSKGMYVANAQLSSAFNAAGGQSTVARVFSELTPYAAAVKDYEFELHFLPWPGTMQESSTQLHEDLQTFVAFLMTITSATPATLASWLSEFHDHSALTEQADNKIRSQLGLTPTAVFP